MYPDNIIKILGTVKDLKDSTIKIINLLVL